MTVLGASGLTLSFGDEVIDQCADIRTVSCQHDGRFTLNVKCCIHSCNQTLTCGFFVTRCSIDLSSEE